MYGSTYIVNGSGSTIVTEPMVSMGREPIGMIYPFTSASVSVTSLASMFSRT
jgi:hypothetical protein